MERRIAIIGGGQAGGKRPLWGDFGMGGKGTLHQTTNTIPKEKGSAPRGAQTIRIPAEHSRLVTLDFAGHWFKSRPKAPSRIAKTRAYVLEVLTQSVRFSAISVCLHTNPPRALI